MGLWVLWVVVAGAFTVGEVHTNGFYLAPFALGAVFAAVLSLVGVGGAVSAVGFLAASLAIILLVRRAFLCRLREPGADQLGEPDPVAEHGGLHLPD